MENVLSKEILKAVLEEACRQWYDVIDECPERKDGVGFADFFIEIMEDKGIEIYHQHLLDISKGIGIQRESEREKDGRRL